MRRSETGIVALSAPPTDVDGLSLSPALGGGTMDNPRAEKVAVVNEVRDRLDGSSGAVLTEYRGLTVAELAQLRTELTAAGGDYKVYKNTLVRLAIADGPHSGIVDLLSGPTAIAFVHGDVSAVAKALRDFAQGNPNLVVKGGIVGDELLSAGDMSVLASLPSRETLLANLAGGLSAPLQQLASLIQAVPRSLAYGLAALVEKRQAEGETLPEPAAAEAATAEPAAQPGAAEPAAESESESESEADAEAKAEAKAEADAAPSETDAAAESNSETETAGEQA